VTDGGCAHLDALFMRPAPIISASLRRDSAAVDTGDRIRIVVEDAGPGLPRQRARALFEMFERGQRESATPGVGLGLAICRAIVAAHDGRIAAENRPEGGARFVVGLPRGEPPEAGGIEQEDAA
jgi:two-component system sensor histidine kinase KdpD